MFVLMTRKWPSESSDTSETNATEIRIECDDKRHCTI